MLVGLRMVTPFELCKRYAAGRISLEELAAFLSDYSYDPPAKTDGFDGLLVNSPNSWSEVVLAYTLGYLTSGEYARIFELRHRTE